MTKKLTGREAVIALMYGKKVKNGSRVILSFHERSIVDQKNEAINFPYIFSRDDWEIVPEPMVWESEETVWEYVGIVLNSDYLSDIRKPMDKYHYIKTPDSFAGKRVKVRIEEIL